MGRGSGGVMSSRKGTKSGYKSPQQQLEDSMSALVVAMSATKTPAGSLAKAKSKVQAAVSKLSDAKVSEYYKSSSGNAFLYTNPKAKDYNAPHNKANRALLKIYANEVKKRKLVVE